MRRIWGGEGREANQSLIAFYYGKLIPNPLTLRDARVRVFSNMRVWFQTCVCGFWAAGEPIDPISVHAV